MSSTAIVIDLRNTPSGGNTYVARSIMQHFVTTERPYQMHIIPLEERTVGARRKFVEYLTPRRPTYPGKVYVLSSRWTGSMGEGMTIGFDAIGATTAGSEMGHLLGAVRSDTLPTSGASIDYGSEILFHVRGTLREDYVPTLYVKAAEKTQDRDPALEAVMAHLGSTNR